MNMSASLLLPSGTPVRIYVRPSSPASSSWRPGSGISDCRAADQGRFQAVLNSFILVVHY